MTDTSTNLSKIQRERLLDICSRIKNKEAVEVNEIAELEQFIKSMKYGLTFERHEEPVDAMLRTHIPVFKEFKEIINNPDSTDCNFLLEGDNLHSLKLLEKTHKGAIDVIYIDPPYNTLNDDFTYGDKMLDENDGFVHSKWLSFMKERLSIAYKLLSKDGIMFISIDDREQSNLKLLCDDIFGGRNVETMVWAKETEESSGKMKRTKHFRDVHEYIIVCYKNKEVQFNKINQAMAVQKLQTTNLAKNNSNKKGDKDRIFTIVNPKNGLSWTDEWKYSKEEVERLLAEDLIYFGSDGTNKPRQILPTDDRREIYVESIITQGSSTAGRKDLESVLGKDMFDNPKPIKLVKTLIKISTDKNATVLDFFTGSGTTGQAVLQLNNEDGGQRRFILCTNNEISANKTLDYLHHNNLMLDVINTGKNNTIQNKIDKFFEENPDVYQKLIVDNNKEHETYGICQSVTFPRIETVITGLRPDGSKYSDGIKSNLKYLQTDMIDKTDDDLDELLYEASFYLAELENMAMIDNVSICIANCDEDIDDIITNATEKLKEIFIADDVLLSSQQKDFFMRHNVAIKQIPNYYYKEM